jgi:hypothetical protein
MLYCDSSTWIGWFWWCVDDNIHRERGSRTLIHRLIQPFMYMFQYPSLRLQIVPFPHMHSSWDSAFGTLYDVGWRSREGVEFETSNLT